MSNTNMILLDTMGKQWRANSPLPKGMVGSSAHLVPTHCNNIQFQLLYFDKFKNITMLFSKLSCSVTVTVSVKPYSGVTYDCHRLQYRHLKYHTEACKSEFEFFHNMAQHVFHSNYLITFNYYYYHYLYYYY